jgi:hypothetical protein
MARSVPDASATLTWCFEDEAMPWTDALLAKLRAGDEAISFGDQCAARLVQIRLASNMWVRFGCDKPYRTFLNLPQACYAYRRMNDIA